MSDFSNYELSPDLNIYELADGMVPEIAQAAGYELTETPNAENLGNLIAKVGPDKELQKNISVVREALGDDARDQIADWIDRSNVMHPVDRSFMRSESYPGMQFDSIVFTGGVANWMLRRTMHTLRFDPVNDVAGHRVVLPIGNREMKPAEHPLVETFMRREHVAPTEADFANYFLKGLMEKAGFRVELIAVDSNKGDEIMDGLFADQPVLLDQQVLVVSNAPNAIQAAGELRLAGKKVDASYDNTGVQVFMNQDSFPLARRGESPKTHQNPETALGQLVRNALYLQRNLA